jgi:hypothetical protein
MSDPMNTAQFLKDSDDIRMGPSGGKQSAIKAWPTEVPAAAILEVAEIMQQGAQKYGSKNWWQISVKSELDHAMKHLLGFLAMNDFVHANPTVQIPHDKMKQELGHAAARILMALDQWLRTPELGQSE